MMIWLPRNESPFQNKIIQKSTEVSVQSSKLNFINSGKLKSVIVAIFSTKKKPPFKRVFFWGKSLTIVNNFSTHSTMAPAKQSQPPGMLLPVLCAGHATGVQLPAKKGLALGNWRNFGCEPAEHWTWKNGPSNKSRPTSARGQVLHILYRI